ncbi:hypothetical protein E4U54_004946, partial [Claviceps lovelessii]
DEMEGNMESTKPEPSTAPSSAVGLGEAKCPSAPSAAAAAAAAAATNSPPVPFQSSPCQHRYTNQSVGVVALLEHIQAQASASKMQEFFVTIMEQVHLSGSCHRYRRAAGSGIDKARKLDMVSLGAWVLGAWVHES